MSGGQNYLLPAMDIAKVGGPLSVVKVCTCENRVSVVRSTFRSQNVKNTTCSDHFLTFRCRSAWQAQGIVHLLKSEQNVRVL